MNYFQNWRWGEEQGISIDWPFDKKPTFIWSSNELSVREFDMVGTLPAIVDVKSGHLGYDEIHTFGTDETYILFGNKTQKRVVVKDSHDRYVSIPCGTREGDPVINFRVVNMDGKVGAALPMEEIITDFIKKHPDFKKKGPALFLIFEDEPGMAFAMGSDLHNNAKFGIMQLMNVYDEKYLYGYSVIHGNMWMCPRPVVMPVYLPITLSTAIGIEGINHSAWKMVMRHYSSHLQKVDNEAVNESKEIIVLSEGGAPDEEEEEYQYIHPRNFLIPTIGHTKVTRPQIPGFAEPNVTNKEVSKRVRPKPQPLVNPKKGKPLPLLPRSGVEPPSHAPSQKRSVRTKLSALPDSYQSEETPTGATSVENTTEQANKLPGQRTKNDEPTNTTAVQKKYVGNPAKAKKGESTSPVETKDEVDSPTKTKKDTTTILQNPMRKMTKKETKKGKGTGKEQDKSVKEATTTTKSLTVDQVKQDKKEEIRKGPKENIYGSLYALPKNIKGYSVEEVTETLHLLAMDQYIDVFNANQIDGSLLVDMDMDMLQNELGMSKFTSMKLLKFVQQNWKPLSLQRK